MTAQNKYLLEDDSGELTDRGGKIIKMTLMGRFGDPDEMIGTIMWLFSGALCFVTGAVVSIDGGFSAFDCG